MTTKNYLFPNWPAPSKVHAACTLRNGGCSEGAYRGFNLSDAVGDSAQAVAANRQQLHRELQLPARPQWLKQIHGNKIIVAKADGELRTGDASFSCDAGVVCAVLTADCLPLLICDRSGTRVAAVHVGWRGLVGGIVRNSIAELGVAPRELLVWLGPAIGPQQFETGVDLLEAAFDSALNSAHASAIAQCFVPHQQKPLHFLADLYGLARAELLQLEVTEIYGGGLCSLSDPKHFYSYRRDGKTGRMASLIWLD